MSDNPFVDPPSSSLDEHVKLELQKCYRLKEEVLTQLRDARFSGCSIAHDSDALGIYDTHGSFQTKYWYVGVKTLIGENGYPISFECFVGGEHYTLLNLRGQARRRGRFATCELTREALIATLKSLLR